MENHDENNPFSPDLNTMEKPINEMKHISTIQAHHGEITSILFFSDHNKFPYLLSSSTDAKDSVIKIFKVTRDTNDSYTFEYTNSFTGHKHTYVNSMIFHEQKVISADDSGRIIAWDVNTPLDQWNEIKRKSSVFILAQIPDGWLSGEEDGTLSIWKSVQKYPHQMQPINSISLEFPINIVTLQLNNEIAWVSSHNYKTVKVINTNNYALLNTFEFDSPISNMINNNDSIIISFTNETIKILDYQRNVKSVIIVSSPSCLCQFNNTIILPEENKDENNTKFTLLDVANFNNCQQFHVTGIVNTYMIYIIPERLLIGGNQNGEINVYQINKKN